MNNQNKSGNTFYIGMHGKKKKVLINRKYYEP